MMNNTSINEMLAEMDVTRTELRIGRNVWNAARKIAVMRIRQVDEIEAHEMNKPVNKTITARTKVYKTNATKVGWHVFTGKQGYLGYYNFTLDSIVKSDTLNDRGERLVFIGGNVLNFEQ